MSNPMVHYFPTSPN